MADSSPGERLRSARKLALLSAEELGRRAAIVLGRDKPLSASAIRNQENGTNGIPMHVAEAYADVLKVELMWLLFGQAKNGPTETPDLGEPDADILDIRDLGINKYGIVSGNWLPEMVGPKPSGEEEGLWIYLEGWTGSSAPLFAYEVGDHSLEPVYPRGTWLITASPHDAFVRAGSHVLCSRYRGVDIVQAIREVRVTRDRVELSPIGSADGKPLSLLDGKVKAERLWVDRVVIATLRELPSGNGPTIDLPDELIFGPAPGEKLPLDESVERWRQERQEDLARYIAGNSGEKGDPEG